MDFFFIKSKDFEIFLMDNKKNTGKEQRLNWVGPGEL